MPLKKNWARAVEMTQWKNIIAFVEDSGSIPRTHMVVL